MPTLVEKLAAAALAVDRLQKLGDNGEYKYLRAFDVCDALRKELFSRGVVIIPEDVEVKQRRPYETVTGDITDEVEVRVQYRVTDGVDVISGAGCGIGQDYHGKAIYKAHTGALKYFLMAIGLIAGAEDDPETVNAGAIPESLAEKLDAAQAEFGDDLREHPISQRDVRAFNSACRARKASPKEVKSFLKDVFGADNVSSLKRKDAQRAMVWAVGTLDDPKIADSAETKKS